VIQADAKVKTFVTNAREWLGRPLGITIPAWSTDPQGIYFGGNEIRVCRTAARKPEACSVLDV
jgi:hypothetical protein